MVPGPETDRDPEDPPPGVEGPWEGEESPEVVPDTPRPEVSDDPEDPLPDSDDLWEDEESPDVIPDAPRPEVSDDPEDPLPDSDDPCEDEESPEFIPDAPRLVPSDEPEDPLPESDDPCEDPEALAVVRELPDLEESNISEDPPAVPEGLPFGNDDSMEPLTGEPNDPGGPEETVRPVPELGMPSRCSAVISAAPADGIRRAAVSKHVRQALRNLCIIIALLFSGHLSAVPLNCPVCISPRLGT